MLPGVKMATVAAFSIVPQRHDRIFQAWKWHPLLVVSFTQVLFHGMGHVPRCQPFPDEKAMKTKLVLSGSMLGFAVLASSVFGESIWGSNATPTRFTVVFVDQMGSDAAKARIMNSTGKADRAKIGELLETDSGLARRLRARGIQLRNILRIETAVNGAKIVYLRSGPRLFGGIR